MQVLHSRLGRAGGAGNLVSANGQVGVMVNGLSASGNVVQGNFIGTDASGTLRRGNNNRGIIVSDGSGNIIGGVAPGAGNVVADNTGTGIEISGQSAAGNIVQGNFVGTDLSGTINLGNHRHGVLIGNANTTQIGGTAAGAGNTIAFNAEEGVGVTSSVPGATGNAIRGNSIFANARLGIDLQLDGVTLNDPGDGDSGVNNLQNFPVLASVISVSGSTTIVGSLNSTPSTTFTLEFFSNVAADPSGFGEGQTFIGSTSVATDPSGNVSFTVVFPIAIPAGEFMSSTATDPAGNTSEFSGVEDVIQNQPPDANANGPYVRNENEFFQLDASASSDPNEPNSSLTFEWDLNYDGFTFDVDVMGEQPTVVFADNLAARLIAVRVTDSGGLSDIATTTLEIKNVRPEITDVRHNAAECGNVAAGGAVTVSVDFRDPGFDDPARGTMEDFTATINWGDGATETLAVSKSNGSPGVFTTGTASGSHAYFDSGIYMITVTIVDDDGGSAQFNTTAFVSGVGLDTGTGVLNIIGTKNADKVSVNKQGNGLLKVHGDFLPSGNFRTFNLSAVNKMVAYLCDGDDHLTIAGNITIPSIIHGGGGNDHLSAGGGSAVLLGEGGNDTLIGGNSFNILIGGIGSDRLVGGNGEDILIGGYTTHDANDAALMSILAEWSNATLPYATRVNKLGNGTGTSGLKLKKSETVFDDGDFDKLTGSAGLDWFFFSLTQDDATDKKNSEQAN